MQPKETLREELQQNDWTAYNENGASFCWKSDYSGRYWYFYTGVANQAEQWLSDLFSYGGNLRQSYIDGTR